MSNKNKLIDDFLKKAKDEYTILVLSYEISGVRVNIEYLISELNIEIKSFLDYKFLHISNKNTKQISIDGYDGINISIDIGKIKITKNNFGDIIMNFGKLKIYTTYVC